MDTALLGFCSLCLVSFFAFLLRMSSFSPDLDNIEYLMFRPFNTNQVSLAVSSVGFLLSIYSMIRSAFFLPSWIFLVLHLVNIIIAFRNRNQL